MATVHHTLLSLLVDTAVGMIPWASDIKDELKKQLQEGAKIIVKKLAPMAADAIEDDVGQKMQTVKDTMVRIDNWQEFVKELVGMTDDNDTTLMEKVAWVWTQMNVREIMGNVGN